MIVRERVDRTRNEGRSIKRSRERKRREKKGFVCIQNIRCIPINTL